MTFNICTSVKPAARSIRMSIMFAGVGVSMDPVSGSGKGPKLYAYLMATGVWVPLIAAGTVYAVMIAIYLDSGAS